MLKLANTILTSDGPLHLVTMTGTDFLSRVWTRFLRHQGMSKARQAIPRQRVSIPNQPPTGNRMKMKTSFKLVTAVAFATLLIHQTARAGSHTWSGVNGVYFNNASNWSYGGAPTNGEQNVYLYFPGGATHYICQNNISNLVVNGIGFSGDNYSIYGTTSPLRRAHRLRTVAA